MKNTSDVLREADDLQLRKSADYNNGLVSREDYYPFGLQSHLTLINTKNLRLLSLAAGQTPNFEGLRDTALDLINYAAYLVVWLDNQKEQHEEDKN